MNFRIFPLKNGMAVSSYTHDVSMDNKADDEK